MIKVSIIIAAYNIEEYIHKCLLSVINQTFKDIEIIVVNDGSTDNTLEKINKFCKLDDRIIIINQKNMGLIEARKAGLNKSKGEFILFIDGDDWIEHNTIEKLYNKAIKENSDIVLYNGFCVTDYEKTYLKSFNSEIEVNDNPIKNLFLVHIMPGIVFKFLRREYIEKYNVEFPKNIGFAEDLAISASLFMYNPKISILDEGLYNYYQRQGSITNTVNYKMLEVDSAISFIKKQLIKNKIYDKHLEEFEMMVYLHLFMNRIISSEDMNDIHKKIYKQYKSRKINIYKNKYIKERISQHSTSLKIRIKAYDKNYYIGRTYDFIRKILKIF